MVTTKVLNDTKINDYGLIYHTKVKVTTEKTKHTRFNLTQKEQLNQDRVASPVIITKKIMIDNDLDPFYDKAIKIKYLKYKNNKYGFLVDQNNRLVTYKLNEKNTDFANSIESHNLEYREINNVNIDQIGYFNIDNDLVIQYYDAVNEDEETASFQDLKM